MKLFHAGVAELQDFNVYKVKEVANTNVSFVEQELEMQQHIIQNGDSLFNYIDTNFIPMS